MSIQNGTLHNVCEHVWQSQIRDCCSASDTRTAEAKTVVYASLGDIEWLSSLSSRYIDTGHRPLDALVTCMTSSLHLERASSAFSTGMSLMAASSSFLIFLLLACFRTSSKEPKGTVMEAGRLISFGSFPLRPEMAAHKLCGNTQWQTTGLVHAAPRPSVAKGDGC